VRIEPIVMVAIRSDGSVEDIIIHRSSGRPELDDAVRRIVRLNSRYGAFPPGLARKYDVIEIRRIWSFDDTLRLLEELR
jgi:TonB family protein